MSDARFAMLADALAEAAARAANAPLKLMSIQFDVLGEGGDEARAKVTRATRTLVFSEAELVSTSGERCVVANAVHRIGR